jgi:hypothetical protein
MVGHCIGRSDKTSYDSKKCDTITRLHLNGLVFLLFIYYGSQGTCLYIFQFPQHNPSLAPRAPSSASTFKTSVSLSSNLAIGFNRLIHSYHGAGLEQAVNILTRQILEGTAFIQSPEALIEKLFIWLNCSDFLLKAILVSRRMRTCVSTRTAPVNGEIMGRGAGHPSKRNTKEMAAVCAVKGLLFQ